MLHLHHVMKGWLLIPLDKYIVQLMRNKFCDLDKYIASDKEGLLIPILDKLIFSAAKCSAAELKKYFCALAKSTKQAMISKVLLQCNAMHCRSWGKGRG